MENEAQEAERQVEEKIASRRPRVFFKSITFQDGTEINFGNNDVVVFVGGNNAGKSQVLKELNASLEGNTPNLKILHKTKIERCGSPVTMTKFVEENSFKKTDSYQNLYSGLGFSFAYLNGFPMDKEWSKEDNIGSLAHFFCRHIQTGNRIKDSNQANSFPARSNAPTNAIQFLFKSLQDEKRINSYFRAAFGQELIVDRGAGNNIPLLVGKNVPPLAEESITDESYGKRLYQNAFPLEKQGDGMRSFASVILQTLAYSVPSILLLDEPEAFLHPPQAKILGRLLATERPRDAQLFIATHSVDILMGLLEAAPENLHIVRLSRNNGKQAVELNKDRAKAIMDDPFLRHSKILSGLFYKRVIICEAESDCLFYQVILETMNINGISDTLFIPTGGKDKLYKLADILKSLYIPIDVIADLDILNNGGGTFQKTIETLGGEEAWTEIEPLWKIVKSAIEGQRGLKTAGQVEEDILTALKKLQKKQTSFPEEIDKNIRLALKNASPWGYMKTAGKNAIPHGEAMEKWQQLQKICARINLWIVPVGELESFCPTGKGHGSEWVHDVLTNKDLNAKELQEAHDFISAVWENKPEELN